MRRHWLVFFVLWLPLACAEAPKRAETAAEYRANSKRAYDEAMEDYFDRNWERFVPKMEELERRYANSRWGRLAALRIADAEFEQQKYLEASTSYKGFAHDHPNDPEVPYARFRAAKALFQSTGDSAILPPLEERDLAQIRDANSAITAHLSDYPTSKWVPELNYMLEVTSGMLARHELYVARFHLTDDRFEAAAARVKFALATQKGSGLEPEAYVLLAEIHLKMKQPGEARGLLEKVLAEYPNSPFTVPAGQFLARLGGVASKASEPSSAAKPQ
ncbi:MAG: outer membrane protein assembly factor BamD [Polyangiaceae bacterium]|nr:outer membrane protein assembly factor BamD [Polyangiaceae bacterium]